MFNATGLDRAWVRRRRLGGATILMYHAVTDSRNRAWIDPGVARPVERFERQIRYLAEHRVMVSLTELVEMVEAGVTPEPRTTVVTFDDAYLNTLRIAGPILARYGVPATLFVVSGWPGEVETPWIDRLFTAFNHRQRHELRVNGSSWSLSTHRAELEAYRSVSQKLLCARPDDRGRLLADVWTQLAPDERPPRVLMDWEEIGRWLELGDGFEVGVHTHSHTDLTLLSEPEIRDEIARGVNALREHFGIERPHFAYPYGRANELTTRVLRESPCRSALQTEPMVPVTGESDPFRLTRIETPNARRRLGFVTSGAYPELSRRLLGRP